MKKWLQSLFVILIAISLLPGLATGGEKSSAPTPEKPLELKWGHVLPGGKFLGHVECVMLADYITKKTNGAITFKIFPRAQLGGGRSMFGQIISGTLDMGNISANVQATAYPEFYVLSLPFAFPNVDVFWDVCNYPGFREKMTKILREKANVQLISFKNATPRNLQNRLRPIRKVEDLKGIKLRVMEGKIYSDIYHALGTSSSTIPVPEIYTALQQGLVDGEDTTLSFANRLKLTEIEKYSTELNAMMSTNPLIMAGSTWDKLSKSQQQLFLDYAKELEVYDKENVEKQIETARKEFVEKQKGHIIKNSDLTREERASFEKAVKPIWLEYKEIVGEEFYNYFMDVLKIVREKRGL